MMAAKTKSVSIKDCEDEVVSLKGAVEDRLLRQKVRLDNGTLGKVFSVVPTEQGPQWRCHPCKITVVGSRQIYQHERSKPHTDKMVQPYPHSVSRFRPQSPPPKSKQIVQVLIATPENADKIRTTAEVQTKLNIFNKAPLIGLEYIIILHDNFDSTKSQCLCILCDKPVSFEKITKHIASLNHQKNYLEKHFPKAMVKFETVLTSHPVKDLEKASRIIISHIAEWVEKRFGRLRPHTCNKETFERYRESYSQTIFRDVHFTERDGETLMEFVDPSLITASDEQAKKPMLSHIPDYQPPMKLKRRSPSPPIAKPLEGIKKRHHATTLEEPPVPKHSKFSDSSYAKRADRSRSRSSGRYPKSYRRSSRSPSPRDRNRSSKKPSTERKESSSRHRESKSDTRVKMSTKAERWEEYKEKVSEIEYDLERLLRMHMKDPETHPNYCEEWRSYLKRRYNELEAQNKNPTKYDFKAEWTILWNERMKELHAIKLKVKKDSLRKRLNLPEEIPPIKFKINAKKNTTLNVKTGTHSTPDVIVIEDSQDEHSKSPKSELPDLRTKYSPTHSSEYHTEDSEDDTQLNIIAVLRLLTALEEKLGSLGPKVIDMLSKALAMEKIETDSSETILDDDGNCVFFETVKEKLKGQLLTGMIESNAKTAAKNAVAKISSILHAASKRKKRQQRKQNKFNVKIKPVTVPDVGDIETGIAKQIAAALEVKERINVLPSNLDQLIYAVVGKSRESQTTTAPITTSQHASPLPSVKPLPNMATTTTPPKTLPILQSTYSNDTSTNAMDGLYDSDLKTLLQNFSDLSPDEQQGLISYLKKLESHEPERVERLRKFVYLSPAQKQVEKFDPTGKQTELKKEAADGFGNLKKMDEIKPIKKEKIKAAIVKSEEDSADSKNLKEKDLERERKLIEDTMVGLNSVLKDGEMMIANAIRQWAEKTSTTTGKVLGVDSSEKFGTKMTALVPSHEDRRDGPPPVHVNQSTNSLTSGSGAYTDRKTLGNSACKPNTMPMGQFGVPPPGGACFNYNIRNAGNEHYIGHTMYQQFPQSGVPPNAWPNFQQHNYQQGGPNGFAWNYPNGNMIGSNGQNYQLPYNNYNALNPSIYNNSATPAGVGNVSGDSASKSTHNSSQGNNDSRRRSGYNNIVIL